MNPKGKRPSKEANLLPLRDKTLRSMIRKWFVTQQNYHHASRLVTFMTDDLLKMINKVSPPFRRVRPGQMVWLALPVDLDRSEMGRPLGDMSLQPIVLTILTEEDIEAQAKARGATAHRRLRGERIARLLKEAEAQGTTLPFGDLAAFFCMSPSGIAKAAHQWEEEHGQKLPHRGRVHDTGSTTTHKQPIIETILQGAQLTKAARRHSHALENIERYYKGYNATEQAYTYTDDPEEIAAMTRLPVHVVRQYMELVRKYRPAMVLKNRPNQAKLPAK